VTSPAVIRIGTSSRGVAPALREIWDYRELLLFLAWRDIQVRYKQTALGAAWAILQPVLTMAIFSLVFGRFAGIPSDGLPYPLFVYCGLVPWQLFAYALVSSSNSLVANERLVTRVYFPRLVVPIGSVLAGVVDFALCLVLLVLMMAYYGIRPGPAALAAPLFALLVLAAALAVGIGLSALNVWFRDVRYTLPFLTQLWLFATPIAYPASIVPESWRPWLGLNPMAAVVEGFRWSLLGGPPPSPQLLLVTVLAVLAALTISLRGFVHVERTFADVI
jgi:lipopolysaccharide transport system permease protein